MAGSLTAVAALMVVLLGAVVTSSAARSGDYMKEAPPRRLALVVGNAGYVDAAALPGSLADADMVASALRDLHFDVKVARNVATRGDFIDDWFLPFVGSIREGDVVAFYFSGHGFSYGGENYLAPLRFSQTVESGDVPTTFLSVTGLQVRLSERRPGLVLMLLDACRNIGSFRVVSHGADDTFLAKGLAEARGLPENTMIGFSSAAGAISIGSAVDEPSVYTKALSETLTSSHDEYDRIRKDVRFAVAYRTGNRQVPWSSDSSSADVYFQPSPEILAQEREFWRAALDEGTRLTIARYLARYGTGPFGEDARRWLADHPDAPEVRASQVSPAAVEAAWTSPTSGDVALPKAAGNVSPPATDVAPRDGGAKIIRDPGQIFGGPDSIFRGALGSNGIAMSSIQARIAPRGDAPIERIIKPGATIAIEGGAQAEGWVRARQGNVGPSFWIERKAGTASALDLGRGIVQLALLPRGAGAGLSALVDEAPLTAALARLKKAGTTVTFAAIATSRAATRHEEGLPSLQGVYVQSVLVRAGLPLAAITTTEDALPPGEGVRVRIFGKER